MRYILYIPIVAGLSGVASTSATAQTRPNEFWTEQTASVGAPIAPAELLAALSAEQALPKVEPELKHTAQHKYAPSLHNLAKRPKETAVPVRRKR